MRFNLLFLLCFFLLAACVNKQQSSNYLYEYLNGAELQCEDEQRTEVKHVLKDLLTLSADALKKKRYKNYTGKTEWSAPYFLERHFVPHSKGIFLNKDTFYQELTEPCVKEIIKNMLEKIGPE